MSIIEWREVSEGHWMLKADRFVAQIFDLRGLSDFNWQIDERDQNGNFIQITADGDEPTLAEAQRAAEDAIDAAAGAP